ncbi:MAG: penicillin-binding protein 1C [Bacteroidota bacterium]
MSFTDVKYSIGDWFESLGKWGKPRRLLAIMAVCILFGVWLNCLPKQLFSDPLSTVMLSQEGELLGARIASDGQWRFPAQDTVPEIFSKTLLAFEDKRFYYHPGFDPLAMARALWLNISRGEVVSGGSTISMQVIRLSRKGRGRTIWEKLIEVVWATRLELRHSKEEILAHYASNAPFGGNVVGLDAAAWKYFGRGADKLSWAEAATLAVLPNAPSLIHPGKNRDLLRRKRDFLLGKLLADGTIDTTSYELAIEENLPAKPKKLPSHTPHLLEEIHQNRLSSRKQAEALVKSSIDILFQKQANQIAKRYYELYKPTGVHNLGILVAEVATGEVKAYVGNTPGTNPAHNCAVNVIPAPRSTGSIMKPYLYASMLNDGELLPHMLIPDVPTRFGSYNPVNYDRTYQGAIPASQALARSLNIPAVRMLSNYGIGRFRDKLRQIGLNSINRSADNYGLTLVLGGAESSLWELTGAYVGMARSLNQFVALQGYYPNNAYRPLSWLPQTISDESTENLKQSAPLSAASIWQTFEAMVEVSRPYAESFWENYASSGKIAWKTGTSYGFRDAWAIGCTPEYVIGVWVGNADGEGRPELVGSAMAAPVMFDMFDVVGEGEEWFTPPYDDMKEVEVCAESGYLMSERCPESKKEWISNQTQKTKPCPYHKHVYLDQEGDFRVHSGCESPLNMTKKSFFILPPLQETYFKNRHPAYIIPPPYRSDCLATLPSANRAKTMEMVYPPAKAKIYIPRELDGELSETVFEATHRNRDAVLFWHLDNEYIGKTANFHKMGLRPKPGKHIITLVDEQGEHLSVSFEILAGEKDKS